MAFCGNCGNAMGDNDKFCGKCGAAAAVAAPIKAPLSIDPKYSGMAPKMTSALPSGGPLTSAPGSPGVKGPGPKMTSPLPIGESLASAPAANVPSSKLTSALPAGEAFPSTPAANVSLPSAKMTAALKADDAFSSAPSAETGATAAKMTSLLSADEPFVKGPAAQTGGSAPKMTAALPAEGAGAGSQSVPAGSDGSEMTVALLNVNKRPGYEASNAYLDGKDSAAGGTVGNSAGNPFGSSSSPFGQQGSGAGSGKPAGQGGLPVFGAGAAASAAFGSGGQSEADSLEGYPFGGPKSGLGPKSSELGPFKGGPIDRTEGTIPVKVAEEEIRQTPPAIQQSGGALVGNVKREASAVTAAAPVSVAVEENGDDIKDYLVPSVIVMLCCCCPVTGLIGIICASSCRTKKQAGDIEGAVQMSSYAKMSLMIGVVLTLLMVIGLIFLGVMGN